MSAQLFWLHEEVLSEALIQTQAAEGCRFLFVFDTVWLAQRPVSLKRIQFIYETLVALPVAIEIVYGDAADVLKQKGQEHPGLVCQVIAPKDPDSAPSPSPTVPKVSVWTVPLTPQKSSVPSSPVNLPPNSPVGFWVMKLIAPAVALRP